MKVIALELCSMVNICINFTLVLVTGTNKSEVNVSSLTTTENSLVNGNNDEEV